MIGMQRKLGISLESDDESPLLVDLCTLVVNFIHTCWVISTHETMKVMKMHIIGFVNHEKLQCFSNRRHVTMIRCDCILTCRKVFISIYCRQSHLVLVNFFNI